MIIIKFAQNNLGYIGLDNCIPWKCSQDLKDFKKATVFAIDEIHLDEDINLIKAHKKSNISPFMGVIGYFMRRHPPLVTLPPDPPCPAAGLAPSPRPH